MSVTGWNILDNLLGSGVVTTVQLVSIETEIDKIVRTIENELATYEPEHFKVQAHVDAASWGAGDRAASIASHHARAHAVMTDTLVGVRKDLRAYQQACRDARRLMEDADLTSAGDLSAIRNAVEAISRGAGSQHGDDAYTQARNAGRNDGSDAR